MQWNHEKKLPRIIPRPLHPRQSPWFIFLVLGVVYIVSYQFLPVLQSPEAGSINLTSMSLRVLYLLQAVVYPLAWIGRELSIESAPVIVWSGTAVMPRSNTVAVEPVL